MSLTATSPDGTTIAYDAWGEGPVVVLVGGALSTRQAGAGIGHLLAGRGFTGVAYDRRGRGDSGDTEPYAVEREIEDVLAVASAAGGEGQQVFLHGMSSGAALVIRVLASGAAVTAASVMEPPYRLPDGPPVPPRYTGTLLELTGEGRNGDALEFFMTQAVGQPQAMVDQMKGSPMWEALLPLAPTLVYDGECLGGDEQGFPDALVAKVSTPVLGLASSGSPEWLQRPAQMVVDAVEGAEFVLMEGGFHHVADEVLVDTIAPFFARA